MATNNKLPDDLIDRMVIHALCLPASKRGAYLLDLECSLSLHGKDGFLVAMMVGERLVYGTHGAGRG